MTEYVSEKQLFTKDDRIGVALSGGADSVALAACLKRAGYNIAALHVEHGIRGEESIRDMRFVEKLCGSLDIPLYIKRADIPAERQKGETLESAARRVRYDFFSQMTEELGLEYIAVAHHIEDASETFLMNLMRGSGLKGLSSMRAKREPNIVRPLLFATRAEIEQYLLEEGLSYVTDSTNDDTDLTRNHIRRNIVPLMEKLNPALHNTLLRTSELIAEEDEALGEIAEREYYNALKSEGEYILLSIPQLLRLNKAIARRVLRIACGRVMGLEDVELSHIEAIYRLAAEGGTGRKYELKGKFFAQVVYNDLKIGAKDYIIDKCDDIPLDIHGETSVPKGRIICKKAASFERAFPESLVQTVDGDALAGAVIRSREPGDIFAPFGSGEKKLKDWMIDKKIPVEKRDGMLLVAKGREILWVIGGAISQKLKVGENTKDLVRIEFISKAEEI